MRFLRSLAWLSIAVLAASCAPPEKMLIDGFLTSVRDGKEQMSAAMSLVSFPDDVDSWEIVEIGPESTLPYEFGELRTAAAHAKEAHEAKIEEDDDFLRSNERIAIRYQQKMKDDPDYRYPGGQMAEFQNEWDARVEQQKELALKASEAQDALETERDAIRKSARMGLKNSFDGDVTEKAVKVRVTGKSGSKVYTLTLRRYNLVDTESGLTTTPTWIVAGIDA